MSFDTSPDAREAQYEAYRRMTGAQRLKIAFDMSNSVREIAKSRIRAQNPSFDEQQITDQLIWELYGIRRPL